MKKLILPAIVLLTLVFFLPQKADAQTEQDCRKIFDKESYKCLGVSGDCQRKCGEETKRPDGGAYFNSGEIYSKCTKANDCGGKGQACNEQALANFRACGKPGEKPKAAEAKKETPKQNQNMQDNNKFKLPVFVGEWFRTLSDWISLGEFAIGLKEVASNLNITDDAIIEDEKEEKEWDQYYQSYNSLKSQGLTHEQIEATLQKPRKRDVSMSLQELDALKAKLPAGESITNVAGTTNTKLYSWETDSGALIKSTNWEKIEFKQPVKTAGGETIRTVKLDEGEMEVRVRNNNPSENQFGVDAGWLGVTVSRTHFWVLKDTDKKLAVVVVYEGEVEVKTKDGKTISVKPESNQPGVVVISQKLSPVKLAVAGLVLIAIIGGTVLFLRKRSKKKK